MRPCLRTLAATALLALAACGTRRPAPPSFPSPPVSTRTVPRPVTAVPNPRLTPGDSVAGVTLKELCARGYTRAWRAVSADVRAEVFTAYKIPRALRAAYELDHLVPLGLGGSNAPRNLWPQPRTGRWSARRKNRLERRLQRLVCRGELSLDQARQAIRQDWRSAYGQFLDERSPRLTATSQE